MMFFSVFKNTAWAACLVLGLSFAPAWAQYQGPGATTSADGGASFKGYIGNNNAGNSGGVVAAQPEPEASSVPSGLPPAFDLVKEAESPAKDVPAVADPCAAYVSSPSGYSMCQDRIRKIDRMREARDRRAGKTPAVAPAATDDTTKTAEEKAKETLEKVEDLEKKLQEKEAADAARKAAPTTKKGIGDFDRNPEKGNQLFK